MKSEYTSAEVFHMYRATGLLSLLDEIIEHIGEQEGYSLQSAIYQAQV